MHSLLGESQMYMLILGALMISAFTAIYVWGFLFGFVIDSWRIMVPHFRKFAATGRVNYRVILALLASLAVVTVMLTVMFILIRLGATFIKYL